jgi:hypothetical protein
MNGNGTGFSRQSRIGLSLLLISLTALEVATMNKAAPLAVAVISLFVIAGLIMFIVPPAR